jgi:7,8-dihydropterin-6-yl-methyl-4-(beta-D-ribofuranosyl)aminobenzene 5'-phosphate synthase
VYVPRSFPRRFKADVCALTSLVEVYGPMEMRPGVHTTGEMGRGIVEQGLAIETGDGLAVVTGCAHPGIVAMVQRAREVAGGDIALVMGGFHLGGARRGRIEHVIADLRRLGVRRVGPCHCTGDQAIRMFEEAFGADFVPVGVGQVVSVGSGEGES